MVMNLDHWGWYSIVVNVAHALMNSIIAVASSALVGGADMARGTSVVNVHSRDHS
jgi:hypothetical protein